MAEMPDFGALAKLGAFFNNRGGVNIIIRPITPDRLLTTGHRLSFHCLRLYAFAIMFETLLSGLQDL